jgi:dihydroorotase
MPEQQPCDLLLRGGRVICPASGIDGVMDVAVRDGRIAAVEPRLGLANQFPFDTTLLAIEGALVTIDMLLFMGFV